MAMPTGEYQRVRSRLYSSQCVEDAFSEVRTRLGSIKGAAILVHPGPLLGPPSPLPQVPTSSPLTLRSSSLKSVALPCPVDASPHEPRVGRSV